jgi:hypothetical protein
MRRYAISGVLVLVVHSATILAQNPDAIKPNATTDRAVYRLFLRHAGWLDRRAAENLAAGKATSMRTVYMLDSGLTADQNERFLVEVRHFIAELEILDAEAARIIKESRDSQHSLAGQPLPPPPPALRELQIQKDRLTEETIERLRLGLGNEIFARLWQHARERIFPHLVKKSLPIGAVQR